MLVRSELKDVPESRERQSVVNAEAMPPDSCSDPRSFLSKLEHDFTGTE